jgi:signal transduction histidine kinase
LVIIVEDHGCGIPVAELGRITKPFYQIENDAIIDGAGLGLTEVVQAVASLGGELSMDPVRLARSAPLRSSV